MSEISASTEAQSYPRISRSYARYVYWVMFAISFLNYLDRYILSGAINVIKKELNISIEGVGYISSAFLIVYTLSTLPFGIWADRAKRKDVVAFCVTAWSLVTAATALATNYWSLFIARMFLGVGEAGYFPAGTALMSDYFPRAVRSRVMSWWGCAQVVGILFGSAIGGWVADLYTGSWRLGFIFTGIPGLLLALLIWRVREPRRNQADDEFNENERLNAVSVSSDAKEVAVQPALPISRGIWGQIESLLRIKTLVVLTLIQIFVFFVLYVSVVFLAIYLQQKDLYGMSSGMAGLYSGGVIALAGMVGNVAGGYLADALSTRYPGARVLVCGIGLLISAPTFAIALLTENLGIFTIFFVLTAIFLSLYQGPSTAALQDVVPASLRATALCISLLLAHLLGDAFSPTIVGILAGTFDPTHGQHFAQNFAGHDLSRALLITCVPALIISGFIGLFGARWMEADVAAAERATAAEQAAARG